MSVFKVIHNVWQNFMDDYGDYDGYLIVASIGNQVGHDEWHDEFLEWYKSSQWLSSRRAACAFIGSKIIALKHPDFKTTQRADGNE